MESAVAPASLRGLVLRGSIWTLGGYGATQLLRLGSNLILTRLLFPDAFGLMSLVSVFMQGLQMFSDIGIGPAIIQNKQGDDPKFLNTAWTMQIVRGFVLWMVSCLIAWPVAEFYAEPMLKELLPVVGMTAAINGFQTTAVFTANRRLQLGRLTILRIIHQIVAIVVLVVWAWCHRSVWALAGGGVVTAAIMCPLGFWMMRSHPHRLHWNRESGRNLLRFGRWIFVGTILTFLAGQIDRLVLGKYASMEYLGVYSIALMLVTLPRDVLGKLVTAILFPVLSQCARKEPARLTARIRLAREVLLPVGVLAVTGIVLGAPVFISLLYDARYSDAGWIAQWLTVFVWFGILQVTAEQTLLALGETFWLAISNLCKVVSIVVGCAVGFQIGGIAGFVLGMGIGAAAGYLVIQWQLHRRGISLIGQDAKFSLIAVVVAGSGLTVSTCSGSERVFEASHAPQCALLGLMLAVLAAWTGHKMWSVLKHRSIGAAVE